MSRFANLGISVECTWNFKTGLTGVRIIIFYIYWNYSGLHVFAKYIHNA